MSKLTQDGMAEPVSRDQILRRERRERNIHVSCSADHEQDWQPYPVDPYSAICSDHTYCTNRRCGKREVNNMGFPEQHPSLVLPGGLHWPCAGGLAGNAICTQLHDPINSGLTR